MDQVFKGLNNYLTQFLNTKLQNAGKKWRQQCVDRYKACLHYILDVVEYENRSKPITQFELSDPNSKATCVILYIYSMDTPFTGLFNKVHRQKSQDYQFVLRSLGPFDRCLQEIIQHKTELNRKDRRPSNKVITAPASFLVYKGCFMSMNQIEKIKDKVG